MEPLFVGDFYEIFGTEDYGTIFIKKDKDVVLIANTLDYFNDGKGLFVKEAKKELKKNYISGKLNFARASFAYENSGKAKGKDSEKCTCIILNNIYMVSH